MQIHLLSSQSSASRSGASLSGSVLINGSSDVRAGHPVHLPEDLSCALREHGHRVEVDLLGDAMHGEELTSLREGATAGRKIAAQLTESGCVLHALDTIAWAAALTARSLTDVSVVLRFSEPVLGDGAVPNPLEPNTGRAGGTLRARGLGSGDPGSGRVSTIGSATERRAYRACLRSADAIAATEDVDRLAAVRAGVPDERALIVPDVVGPPAEQSAPAILRPGRNVLSLSGIGPDSGIETLFETLRRLPDRELVVIGHGSDADDTEFQARVARWQLTGRIRRLGRVDRETTTRLIDDAALVVLPTAAATAGDAVTAMIRSRPVVTVAGGSAADAVVDGITGAVLPAGHPELFCRTLRSLLSNPFQLEAMGLAGRERALSRYARSRAVSATEQAYRVALGAA